MILSTDDSYLSYSTIQNRLYGIIGPILIAIGSVGAIFSCFVFAQKTMRKNPGSVCFIAFSVKYPSSNLTLAVTYWNLACAFYQQRQLTEVLKYFRKCESIVTHKLNVIFHDLRVKQCKDWIQRIKDELLKEPHQIRKGYGPDPWLMFHPYNMSFTLE